MCLSGILYLKKSLIKRTIRLLHSLYVGKERNADKKSGKERNKAKLISFLILRHWRIEEF
jgi:hypothetical protein